MAFLKIAAQAFEAGDFLNILLRFGVFEAHFLIKNFLIKKDVYDEKVTKLFLNRLLITLSKIL